MVGWSDQMTKLLIADPATQHDVTRYRTGIKCTKTKADLTFLPQCDQNLNTVVFMRGGLTQQDAAPTPAYSTQKPSAFFGLFMQGGGGTCAGFIQNFFKNESVWCKKAIHCLSSPTVSPSPHRACVTLTQILCGLDPFRAGPRMSYTYTFSKSTKIK